MLRRLMSGDRRSGRYGGMQLHCGCGRRIALSVNNGQLERLIEKRRT